MDDEANTAVLVRPRLGSAADPDAGTHPLMTVREAARALRVSEMTVRRAIHDRTLAAIRVGRAYRVPRSFVDRLLTEADCGRTVVATEVAVDRVQQGGGMT